MSATSPGDLFVAVLGYGVLALTALLILWVVLYRLRFPPVVRASASLRRRRIRRHVRVARVLGMQYAQDDDSGLLDLPLSLMSWGTNRWVHEVTYGEYRGRDVRLFRLYYQLPGGRYGPTMSSRRGAVARIEAAFPHVVVERRRLFIAGEQIHGAEEVRFDPEFDEEFRVLSTDAALAADLLDANVRRWLMGIDKRWRFEISGPWVLAYEESSRDRVDERAVLDMVSELADRIPWILLQEHPAGSAPDPLPLPVGPAPPTERQLRRRRVASKVIGAVAVVFLMFVVAGIVAGIASDSGSKHPCPECTPPNISFAPPSFAPPSIAIPSQPVPTPTLVAAGGRPIVLAGLRPGERVTVTFLGLTATPHPTIQPGRPAPPSDVGARFLIVNTGIVPYEDFPANGIVLLTAEGRRLRPSLIDTFTPGFETIHLEPGDRARGFVTFRVPGSTTPAAVLFHTDSGFGAQTGRWEI